MNDCALTATREQARCLLDPQRAAILEALREPGSAAAVARRLNQPRQKVAYHVKQLEEAGLLEHVADRRAGNCTERVLKATARHYAIDPALLGPVALQPGALADRFSSAYQVASALAVATTTALLREAAEADGQKLATLTLETEIAFDSPRAQYQFARDFEASLRELVSRYHRPGDEARRIRLSAYAHPATDEEQGHD